MTRVDDALTGRERMKALAHSCAERLTPVRMNVVGKGKERSTGRDVEVFQAPHETRPGSGREVYYRRIDQTPAPYGVPIRDRVNGRIKGGWLATPTAPLRRVR